MVVTTRFSTEPVSADGNYMNDTQFANYLADLRSHRAARLNSTRILPRNKSKEIKRGQEQHDFTDSNGRRSVSTSSRDGESQPHCESVCNDDDDIVQNNSRWLERQEARSLRIALQDSNLMAERQVADMANHEASNLIRSHMQTKKLNFAPTQDDNDLTHTDREIASRTKPKSYHGLAHAVANDIAMLKRRVSSGERRRASGEKKMFPTAEDRIFEDPEPIPEESDHATLHKLDSQPSSDSHTLEHVRRNPFARARLNRDSTRGRQINIAPKKQDQDNSEKDQVCRENAAFSWYSDYKTNLRSTPILDQKASEPGKLPIEIRSEEIRAATGAKRRSNPRLPQPTVISPSMNRPITSFEPHLPNTSSDGRNMKHSDNTQSTKLDEFNRANQPLKMQPRLYANDRTAPTTTFVPLRTATDLPVPIPILNLPDDDGGMNSKTLAEEPDMVFNDPLRETVGGRRITPEKIHPAPPLRHGNSTRRPLPDPLRSRQTDPKTVRMPTSLSQQNLMSDKKAVLCAGCSLPIAGRVLTAASERFHPECFTCHQCNINLECVAFYPEPDDKYVQRMARIQQRIMNYYELEDEPSQGDEQDDEPALKRFFCHLDYHELFSPRCKSCKTPIEGEVVVACGAEWHVGHFFCAQCGDPFDSSTPFVEKDGYAWCVNCHTNRYSSKCRKCKKPITDLVITALDSDWHEDCFCCTDCGSSFEQGQYFLRGPKSDPVCVRCEDLRLKA